jgi:hypothetical protein
LIADWLWARIASVLVVCGMALLSLLIGAVIWQHAHQATSRPTVLPTSTSLPVASAVAAPATKIPTREAGGLPSPGANALAAFAAARPTAEAFLEAYASYRWDESADGLRRRLRPYDTDALDSVLAQSRGTSADSYAAQRHEVAVGHVKEMTAESVTTDGRLSVVASVEQEVKSDQGTATTTTSIWLALANTPGGWRADEIRI